MTRSTLLSRFLAAIFLSGCFLPVGCSINVAGPESANSTSAGGELSGKILIDGSSTVYPISQAMSEEFGRQFPKVQIPVGSGGTSSGFKKLNAGEIDIAGASRPITPRESEGLKEKGIEVVELQVALDGLSIAVNRENTWCTALTVKQLHELWKPESAITVWKELNPSWPDSKIKLFGAGTNSGTFEYFTETINGKKGASRSDYSQSEDDNQLVIGVSGDQYALGYFGYSYFDENRERLKIVKITDGDDLGKAIEPTRETIENGTYKPLSRPVYIYVTKKALGRREVAEFVKFYLSDAGQKLVATAHCVGLNSKQLAEQRKHLDEAIATVRHEPSTASARQD